MIFRYYPEIHFYTHFRNSNSQKKFLDTEKISFSKADLYKATHKAWELTEKYCLFRPETH